MNSVKQRGLSSERSFKQALHVHTNTNFDTTSYNSTTYSPSPRSNKSKHPMVQDSIRRLTTPYKKKALDMTASLSPEKFGSTLLSPLRMRPTTATSARGEAFDFLSMLPTEKNGGFPTQDVVEGNLKNSLVTLKTVVREYEDQMREKKIMSKVVDQLKAQIAGLQARKVTFSKNFEKLHKDALIMNDSCLTKENQRVLIGKNISQVKDGVIALDRDIQESIKMNVEVAKAIKMEQQEIIRLRNEIAEMKKVQPSLNREKDRLRNELQVSSKLLHKMEEKFTSLTREKGAFIQHIDNSKSLKSNNSPTKL